MPHTANIKNQGIIAANDVSHKQSLMPDKCEGHDTIISCKERQTRVVEGATQPIGNVQLLDLS